MRTVLLGALLIAIIVSAVWLARESGLIHSLKLGRGNGIARHGFLHVEGVQLTDAHGKALQLRGMSSHGLQWYPAYVNYQALVTTREYGANLFRAAMYADSIHDGYNQDEKLRHWNGSMLHIAIENALGADMYVIADWHLLMDGNPLTHVEEAVRFFDGLSKRYANEPGVLYEICNEPNGETTWADIRTYAEEVIPVIRKNSPDAVILVGTPDFSTGLQEVAQSPLDFDNIMYSYHFYTSYDSPYEAELDAAREAGLPVFVTEWGIGLKNGRSQEEASEEANAFIAYLKQHTISWAGWSLSNKAEPYAAIRADVDALSGWTEEDLTPSGKLVFDALAQ